MIKSNNTWHSPLNVYWHVQKLTDKIGAKAIEKEGAYQGIREARIGAVLALAMFDRLGKPTYLQLYKPDPPDLIFMQQGKNGQREITQVEITSYVIRSKESLLEQLRRTKTPPGITLFSENYILLVNVGVGLEVDYEPIRDYLNQNKKIRFPVWTLQEISSYPDTIAKLVIVNPQISELEINIGEVAHRFGELDLPGVIHSKRVANRKFVRAEPSEPTFEAPWETVGK